MKVMKDRYMKRMSRGKEIKNGMTIFISMAIYNEKILVELNYELCDSLKQWYPLQYLD